MNSTERLNIESNQLNLSNNHKIRNINDDKRRAIKEVINAFKEENKKMFDTFKLTPSEYFEDRIIKGRISFIWTMLCDSLPEKMKGYGELNEHEKRVIE